MKRDVLDDQTPRESAEAPFPLVLLSLDDVPVALVRSGTHPSVLPFDVSSCVARTITCREALLATPVEESKKWRLQAKVTVSLDATDRVHWVMATSATSSDGVCLRLDDTTTTVGGIQRFAEVLDKKLAEMLPDRDAAHTDVRVFIMSEPSSEKVDSVLDGRSIWSAEEEEAGETHRRVVNERVFLADSVRQLCRKVADALRSFFVDGERDPTAVFWPAQLPFPVNIHADNDRLRVAEHEELLLPRCGLLRGERRLKDWEWVSDITRPLSLKAGEDAEATGRAVFRTGAPWERHLVTNPHAELKVGPTPVISGAETLLTTGRYDYYHYHVDGFKDDGWGCAYRSLQTILSWFQHEGVVSQPMPSLREIQQILSVVDPDKAGKKGFVGSSEWIGSFEIMMVLQHYVPGLECTIKRLESGAELDSDPVVQSLLMAHFSQEKASPVMIGGSSYAHTILGVHMNVATTEAQYLILDPHYSANPTNLKTAIAKGYVGWKEASKFFEAGQWYNVCIPRTDTFDPR